MKKKMQVTDLSKVDVKGSAPNREPLDVFQGPAPGQGQDDILFIVPL